LPSGTTTFELRGSIPPLPPGALHNKSILDSFFGSFAIYNYQ
jgi:hypothetical protein